MPKQNELTAKFLGERRVFNNGDESRVIIGDAELADGNFSRITIKGDAAESALTPGMTYRFYGYGKTHHKYGDQFIFSDFVAEQPADQDGIVAYLMQCKGIGPATAHLLWDSFGPDAVRVMREEPEIARRGIPRFTFQMAKAASELLQRNEHIEKTKIELIGLFSGRGFPKKLIGQLIEHFGTSAAQHIKRNPYKLMKFRGCGFLRTDKMFLDLGFNPSRLKRQVMCLWHGVQTLANGDTWISMSAARDCLIKSIAGSSLQFDRAVQMAAKANLLVTKTENGRMWIAEFGNAKKEEQIARWLDEARLEKAEWPNPLDIPGLSEHQRDELRGAFGGTIGVLAGRPGTGKTYTAAAIIRAVQGQGMIAACAPTGKAAARLNEVMHGDGVIIEAKTVHRTLVVNSVDGDWSFDHGPHNPLPYQFIFVDEVPMIGTDLMHSLLSARSPGTHILFIGDINQLSPIGHGAPMRDFLAAGVPHGHLTKIERNSGQIVKTCADIIEKKRFTVSDKIDIEAGKNLKVLPAANPEDQIKRLMESLESLESKWGIDPVWGCQVIVAVNEKSPLARKPLNKQLQGILNPHGENSGNNPFRVGDKIICTKNKQFPEFNPTAEGDTHLVANGEFGEAIDVEELRTVVRLTSPDRIIIVPRGTGDNDDDDEEKTGTGCDWELGYAISCHKMQGSECPVIFVMLDEYPGARMVMSQQWLITAISRARLFTICIGKKSTADACVHRDSLSKRKTFLRELVLQPQQAVFEGIL
jgi:exodeoxyribonuclease V alpha subunit